MYRKLLRVLFVSIFILCSNNEDDTFNEITYLISDKPKYHNKRFIELERIFEIPLITDNYTIGNASSLAVSEDTILYVLDQFNCDIHVFNSKGLFLKKMGGIGDGPSELRNGRQISVYNNRLYITEKYKGIKIWNSNGKYIDYLLSSGDLTEIKPTLNIFYGLNIIVNQNNNERFYKFTLNKYSAKFKHVKEILTLKIPIEDAITFFPAMIPVNSKSDLFYPINSAKYIIQKYNIEGEPILSFGRKYDSKPFSKKIQDFYKERYKKFSDYPSLPKYPPIIRDIFIDDKDLIWVTIGEGNMDIPDDRINSTIDIFNENGEFLYTFNCQHFLSRSIFKYNRFYARPNIEEEHQKISVFRVKYNF